MTYIAPAGSGSTPVSSVGASATLDRTGFWIVTVMLDLTYTVQAGGTPQVNWSVAGTAGISASGTLLPITGSAGNSGRLVVGFGPYAAVRNAGTVTFALSGQFALSTTINSQTIYAYFIPTPTYVK